MKDEMCNVPNGLNPLETLGVGELEIILEQAKHTEIYGTIYEVREVRGEYLRLNKFWR